jgi:hypothetical protein
MTETRQVCSHFMSGNCKYGQSCTKIHISPTVELLQEIEKKGPIVCNYHPNCKFTSKECKKIHVDYENTNEKDITELRRLYMNIISMEQSNGSSRVQGQIDRVKAMIKYDIDFLRDTYECLSQK